MMPTQIPLSERIEYYLNVLENATYEIGFDVASIETLRAIVEAYIIKYNPPALSSLDDLGFPRIKTSNK